MGDIIESFFSRNYENKINKNILYYEFSQGEVEVYVKDVINEPVQGYIDYIESIQEREVIRAEDVFQFSNFKDATDNFCEKIKEIDNPGLSHLEIGKLLQDDGKDRTDGAYIKYGENHAKLAKELGLAFELCNTYYLSGVGYVYEEMALEDRERLLVRLILRSKIVTRLYQASKNGKVNLRQFLYTLADSTYVRRRSNIKKVMGYLVASPEYDFKEFIDFIVF